MTIEFEHPSSLWGADAGDAGRWAVSDQSQLPDLPTRGGMGKPQNVQAAYAWASYMIYVHGARLAPYWAAEGLSVAMEANNIDMQAGFLAIIDAIADLLREPCEGEAVH
jgi:hypothetical protein